MLRLIIISILVLILVTVIVVDQTIIKRQKNIKKYKCKYFYALFLEHQLSNGVLLEKEIKRCKTELEIIKMSYATCNDIMELKYEIDLLRNAFSDKLNERLSAERERILKETLAELTVKFTIISSILKDYYHIDSLRKSIRISEILDIHYYLEDKKKLLRERNDHLCSNS